MLDSAGATWAPGSEAEVRVNVEDEWRLETTLRRGREGVGGKINNIRQEK